MVTNAKSLNFLLSGKRLHQVGVYHKDDILNGIMWFERESRKVRPFTPVITEHYFFFNTTVIEYDRLETRGGLKYSYVVVTKRSLNFLYLVVSSKG